MDENNMVYQYGIHNVFIANDQALGNLYEYFLKRNGKRQ
jgi:hypothetical protein